MFRRNFLHRLVGVPLVAGLASQASASPSPGLAPEQAAAFRAVLLETFVAGFRFHQGPGVLGQIRAGDRLELVPEPENPHDRHAVRLEWKGVKLGYVPREPRSRVVTDTLAQGAVLHAEVVHVDADAPPWEAVRFAVHLSTEGAPPAEAVPAMVSAAEDNFCSARSGWRWS